MDSACAEGLSELWKIQNSQLFSRTPPQLPLQLHTYLNNSITKAFPLFPLKFCLRAWQRSRAHFQRNNLCNFGGSLAQHTDWVMVVSRPIHSSSPLSTSPLLLFSSSPPVTPPSPPSLGEGVALSPPSVLSAPCLYHSPPPATPPPCSFFPKKSWIQ